LTLSGQRIMQTLGMASHERPRVAVRDGRWLCRRRMNAKVTIQPGAGDRGGGSRRATRCPPDREMCRSKPRETRRPQDGRPYRKDRAERRNETPRTSSGNFQMLVVGTMPADGTLSFSNGIVKLG
jgi:hypothetical protein